MKKTKILLVGALLLGVPSVALSLSTQQENATVVRAEETTTTYSYTFKEKVFSGNEQKSLNNINWTLSGDGGFWDYNSTKGQHLGSSSKPYKSLILSTNDLNGKNIVSVKINTCGGSKIKASFNLKINDNVIDSSKTLSTSATDFSFNNINVLCSTGISFEYTQTSAKAIYIKSIEIVYSSSNTPVTNYFIKYENTNLTNGCFVTSTVKGSDLPTPENTLAQTFEGWYLDSAFTQKIEATTEITLKEDAITTIYAKWVDVEYEITNIADVISKASGTFVIEGEIVGKKNDSTVFIQDATGGIMLYDTSNVLASLKLGDNAKLKGTYTLFNKCHELTSISIISTSSDGKIDTSPITSNEDVSNNNLGKYVKLRNLKIKSTWTGSTKLGYTANIYNNNFVLYYSNKDYSKNIDLVTKDSYVNIEGCITIYGSTLEVLVTNVEKANTFTITYNTLGGTSVSSQTIGEGEKYTKPTNPTKANTEYEEYQFVGWYLDENCSDGKEFNFDNDVTGSVTVYAKWNVTKKSVSTKFTSVETKASLGFDYTETITKSEEELLTSTFIGNNIEKPFTVSGHSYSKGTNSLINSTSYIEFEIENELTDEISITFSGTSNNHSKIKFVSYDDNRNIIETSIDYTLESSHTNIECVLNKYENVKYIRLEVSYLADNDTINFATYQLLTLVSKATKSYSNFRNVMMQFRYEFDASKFEDVSSIGIALTKDTEFNFEQQGLEALPENIKLYETKKDNGTDYNTSLTIGVKNIPTTAYDTSLVAVAYVKTTEGKYYFAKKSTYSVNKMIETYIDTLDTNTEMYKILEAFFDSLQ